ncbi:hypothetical protein MHYP_G00205830 [Metynnis hypsauchen]
MFGVASGVTTPISGRDLDTLATLSTCLELHMVQSDSCEQKEESLLLGFILDIALLLGRGRFLLLQGVHFCAQLNLNITRCHEVTAETRTADMASRRSGSPQQTSSGTSRRRMPKSKEKEMIHQCSDCGKSFHLEMQKTPQFCSFRWDPDAGPVRSGRS